MELIQLEALLAVVEVGTFSGAAGRLSLTQSALTRRIQSLEVEFGRPLLVRTRPRAELTPTGEEVAAAARRIASEVDGLRALAPGDTEEPRGPLRAAATAIGLTYLYWRTCEQFLRAHPHVDLVFHDVETPADAARLVKGGGADVAFTALPLPADVQGLQVVVLGNVETVLVASRRHPVAQGKPSRARLRQIPMLVSRRRSDTSHFVNQSLFQRLGGRPHTVLETGDTEYIKRLVSLGRGITALPWPAVEREVRAGELVALDALTPAVIQDFGLVLPRGRMGTQARVLADFCRSLDFVELQRN
ncbi:MAG TPA: LysR family transcriptional regulator [Chloroflexota bacterium]|jgi:DNA-binding transcriptional LysR family regulator